jgi:ABC-type multidrug transport system fused ATPase/permease subunit
LVDEATANIDQKNDQLIQDVISTKFKESTVLTIAHRLSTLKNSDKILVLGEGKVLEWGSPQELMVKDGGIYREMCQKGNITDEYLI